MSDKPKPPEPDLPEAWKQPPDPSWKPTRHPPEQPPAPPGTGRTVFKVLAWSVAVVVGLPVLGLLLLFGSCLLGGGRY